MKTVKVKKIDLLITISRNLNEHRDEVEKLNIIYREKMMAAYKEAINNLLLGGDLQRHFDGPAGLPQPEDHCKEYAAAILMIEWSTEETIELEKNDFQKYILNNWEWTRSFNETIAHYGQRRD